MSVRVVAEDFQPTRSMRRIQERNADLIGVSWGSRYPWARPAEVRAAYHELFRRCAAGELRPPVTRVSPPMTQPPACITADQGLSQVG